MNFFWRITLLGSFVAAGIGLALGVAYSSNPAIGQTQEIAADPSASATSASTTSASTADVHVASAVGPVAASMPEEHTPAVQAPMLAGPIVEKPAEKIASDASPPPEKLAQNSTLEQLLRQSAAGSSTGNTAGNQTHSGSAGPSPNPSSQAELMDQLRRHLENAMQQNPPASTSQTLPGPASSRPVPGDPTAVPSAAVPSTKATPSRPRIERISGEGDDNLSIHVQDSDLREVLNLLSEQGGLNILPSPSVQGKVSLALNGVDIDTALDAILRSTGFVAKREGKFIYVGTTQDFKAMDQAADRVGTRIYRLNYVRAADIQALIQPILTPGVGSVTVTAPAENGIAPDDSRAGGDQFAGGDSVLIHDYLAVLDHVDQIVAEIDRKPAQVAIEAMILEVSLKDNYEFGVDFEFFRSNPHVRLATGTPLEGLNDLDFAKGGLKFGYLDGNTGAFVSALESIGDTNVIASPRLMVVNKARAEILIGEQLGYVNTTITETSTAQNVQFLEVGAQLRLRPFIASDGLIRMEVHPELSTGTVQVREGFTLPEKRVTQVTTNIMVRDGCTVVIGGLMREDLQTITTQVPLLGSLPAIGVLFRNKNEKIDKREIIVLLTPHIVCEPDMCCEGDEAAGEFHRRQAVYADQMSPIGKRYLGRRYYRLAQAAWAKGDQKTALRFIDLAIHFDPESRAAIDLRVDIWNGNLTGDHTLRKAPERLPMPDTLVPDPMMSSPMVRGGMPGLPPMSAGPDGEIVVPNGTAPFIVPEDAALPPGAILPPKSNMPAPITMPPGGPGMLKMPRETDRPSPESVMPGRPIAPEPSALRQPRPSAKKPISPATVSSTMKASTPPIAKPTATTAVPHRAVDLPLQEVAAPKAIAPTADVLKAIAPNADAPKAVASQANVQPISYTEPVPTQPTTAVESPVGNLAVRSVAAPASQSSTNVAEDSPLVIAWPSEENAPVVRQAAR